MSNMSREQERGEVEIAIISASNLAAKDSNGSSDPYVRVTCMEPTRSRKKTTSKKDMNLNPTWNERFFFADVAGNARIIVDVYDADEEGRDDLIGKVTISLDSLARNQLLDSVHEMIDGDIRLAIAFRPGKTVEARADELDASAAVSLYPGGPDGPLLGGMSFGEWVGDRDELLGEIRAISEQLRKSKGREFEDEDFSGPRSLFIDPKHVAEDFLRAGQKQTVMLRPREINGKMRLFFTEAGDTNEIEPDDIKQGEIGDCYLLAALGAIAGHEHLIKGLLVEDFGAQGLYGVKLCDWTGWRTVIVDDRLVCDAKSRAQVFCHSDSGLEFWASIFEKAWAKLHGNYEVIEGGDTADTIAYLTGGRCSHISFNERTDPAAFWEECLGFFGVNDGPEEDACFLSAGGAVGSKGGKEDPESVAKDDPGGLVSGHAYSVLELRQAGGVRLIKLRNPWGSFEWNGDWSDSSSLWTPQMVAAFNFRRSDDGEFCHAPARANAPLPPLSHLGKTTVHLMLSQPDTRELGGGGFLEMMVRVFLLGADADPHAPLEPEQLLEGASVTVWSRKGTLSVEVDPAKGQYVVLLSLWAPGWEGDFGLTVALEGRGARLGLQELAPLLPPAEAAAEMRAKPLSNKCATCRLPCALGRGAKFFKCTRWHDRPECYLCKSCQPCFRDLFAPSCLNCKEPVTEGSYFTVSEPTQGRVHSHCYDEFRESSAPRCSLLTSLIIISLFYSFYSQVHVECFEQYTALTADKCYVCAKPLSGSFYDLPEGKVHSDGDCYDRHMEAQAPKCISCGKAVTGQFYELPEGLVHAEGDCYDKSQRR
ncbi:hypothetical protein T492DRAFT_1093835 [Pavlovales sp. CCMP2436]|nr:hypothetical protein T492DRAFT_1093835 [Pavlovales sp. CCMP2436]